MPFAVQRTVSTIEYGKMLQQKFISLDIEKFFEKE